MGKEGRDVKGFFGDVIHYDGNGKKIGVSRRGLFGYTDYDANGKRMGNSIPNIFGGLNHYDTKGKKTGESTPRFFGGSNHYDADGNLIGQSTPSFIGGWDYRREQQREAETAGAYHESRRGSQEYGNYGSTADPINISYGSSVPQYYGTEQYEKEREEEKKEGGGILMLLLTVGYLIFCIVYMLNMRGMGMWGTGALWVFSGVFLVATILNNYGHSKAIIIPKGKDGTGIYMKKWPMYIFIGLMALMGLIGFIPLL